MNKKIATAVLFVMTLSTAVAPAITTINNDVCATAASGAVQTQILGISVGSTVRDMNCERIKLSKNLYDMGMKVAAVATHAKIPQTGTKIFVKCLSVM